MKQVTIRLGEAEYAGLMQGQVPKLADDGQTSASYSVWVALVRALSEEDKWRDTLIGDTWGENNDKATIRIGAGVRQPEAREGNPKLSASKIHERLDWLGDRTLLVLQRSDTHSRQLDRIERAIGSICDAIAVEILKGDEDA